MIMSMSLVKFASAISVMLFWTSDDLTTTFVPDSFDLSSFDLMSNNIKLRFAIDKSIMVAFEFI